jgi:hypothetical protein
MTSLLQSVGEAIGIGSPPTQAAEERIKRGRDRARRFSSYNNACWRFWRNDQYVWVDSKGFLQSLPTVRSSDGGLPPHKVRTTRNLLFDHVEHEVAAAVSRVPSYDVLPSSTDPRRIDAALLSEKLALYGHEKWDIPLAVEKMVRSAVVTQTGEGFAWPYFDNTYGTPLTDEVSTGEICIRTFGPNEVFWEPGIRFEDSRWHVVEQARSLDDIRRVEGFDGAKLKPDANTSDLWTDKGQGDNDLAIETNYFERPSAKHKQGRWLVFANKRQICPERAFPLTNADGEPVDEPVLVKLHYALDADSDRDRGLVPYLMDPQATLNDCVNKSLEAKNLGLVPQGAVQEGLWPEGQKRTDEPGIIYKLLGDPNTAFKWLDPPSPQLFAVLENLADQAERHMGRIAAQNDIPSQVEAGKAIATLIERDSTRRANFISNLARVYAKIMHRSLVLVQQHYSDARLIKIKGAFGVETIDGFKGSDLMGEIDVRVLPSSIEPLTRESLEQKLTFYAQMGWIAPEKAIAAIQAGTAESIVASYELQVRAEQREIQRMTALAGTLSPTSTAQDFAKAAVPIPKPWENHRLRMSVLADYFATGDFEALPEPVKNVMEQHYNAHDRLAQQQALQQVQQQTAMAQTLGMGNAARPTQPGAQPTQMPSPPASPEASPPTSQ